MRIYVFLLFSFMLFYLDACSPSNLVEAPEENLEVRFRVSDARERNLKHYRRSMHKAPYEGAVVREEPDESLMKITLRDTPEVRYFLDRFTSSERDFISEALLRRQAYLPTIETILSQYGLPPELSSIALIESRFNPEAGSFKGAVGLWQLMKSTAEAQGLSVSFFEDERKDVKKSTYAAAQYFTRLYDELDDWLLVIAAYNVGPTVIRRKVEQTGLSDFYELVKGGHISPSVSNFVSKFIAISMILRNPDLYGFEEDVREVEHLYVRNPKLNSYQSRARMKNKL